MARHLGRALKQATPASPSPSTNGHPQGSIFVLNSGCQQDILVTAAFQTAPGYSESDYNAHCTNTDNSTQIQSGWCSYFIYGFANGDGGWTEMLAVGPTAAIQVSGWNGTWPDGNIAPMEQTWEITQLATDGAIPIGETVWRKHDGQTSCIEGQDDCQKWIVVSLQPMHGAYGPPPPISRQLSAESLCRDHVGMPLPCIGTSNLAHKHMRTCYLHSSVIPCGIDVCAIHGYLC